MKMRRTSVQRVVQQKRKEKSEIARKEKQLEEQRQRSTSSLQLQLANSTVPVVVAFVDLCGSTELKKAPQETWLPIIAEFLWDITECVRKLDGSVIKYIGDEVLAVFEQPNAALRAEAFVLECERTLRTGGSSFAKYALDLGDVLKITVPGGAEDILGVCVDRCARIAKLLSPGTALASAVFVGVSPNPTGWVRRASVHPKGIADKFDVYQLKGVGKPIVGSDIRLRASSSPGTIEKEMLLSEQLKICRTELGRLRGIKPKGG